MRPSTFFVALLALAPSIAAAQQLTPAEVFERSGGAVVKIEVPDASRANAPPVLGSGVIISRYGLAVTAKHVLAGYVDARATPIRVRIHNGTQVGAEPMRWDIGIDAALLILDLPQSVGLASYPVARRGN